VAAWPQLLCGCVAAWPAFSADHTQQMCGAGGSQHKPCKQALRGGARRAAPPLTLDGSESGGGVQGAAGTSMTLVGELPSTPDRKGQPPMAAVCRRQRLVCSSARLRRA